MGTKAVGFLQLSNEGDSSAVFQYAISENLRIDSARITAVLPQIDPRVLDHRKAKTNVNEPAPRLKSTEPKIQEPAPSLNLPQAKTTDPKIQIALIRQALEKQALQKQPKIATYENEFENEKQKNFTSIPSEIPKASDYFISDVFKWDAESGCFYDPASGYYFDIHRRLYF